MANDISAEKAWAGYRENMAAFEAAGIPWNKKGSPHRLRLKAKWYLQYVPFHKIVAWTFEANAPKLAANVAMNNALLRRLMKHG